jgi:capsid portal protein
MAQRTMGLGTGVLPPPPPADLGEVLKVSSKVIRLSSVDRRSTPPTPVPWMSRGISGIMSPHMLEDLHAERRLEKLDAPEMERSSSEIDEDHSRRAGIPGFGPGGDYVEPPFDLRRLAELLYHSPDYFATVDQMALDIAGDWTLIDARDEEGAGSGRVSTFLDDAARLEAEAARQWLEGLPRDIQGERISVEKFANAIMSDYLATGNAYVEVVRSALIENGKPQALIHIPSYLIRRSASGGLYVQVTEMGRGVAYFRRFDTPLRPFIPGERNPQYLSEEEAGLMGKRPGLPKGELADFCRYHSAERYYGVPPIVAAFNQVAGNIFASNRNVRFFVSRGIPDYLCIIRVDDASLTDITKRKLIQDAQAMLEEHMEYMLKGQDHKTLTMTLPTGDVNVEFMRIGDVPSDQEWGGYQRDNRDTILRVYRMRPEELGIIETAHLGSGTGENQAERYKRSQVEPGQRMLEDFWNNVLDAGEYRLVRYKNAELDIIDEQMETGMANAALDAGGISINEYRRWLSRVIKEQDFPDDEHEWASVPWKIVELQMAGTLGPGGPAAQPGANGMLAAMLGGQGRARPEAAADMEALRSRRSNAGFASRMDEMRRMMGLQPRAPRQAPPATIASNAETFGTTRNRNGARNGP